MNFDSDSKHKYRLDAIKFLVNTERQWKKINLDNQADETILVI